MQQTFWDGIEAVFVINLDHRTDRWEAISSQLAAFVPEGKVHRISACLGRELPGYKTHRLFRNTTEDEALLWAGRAGCILSQKKCIELARERGLQKVLILEDDAFFDDPLTGGIGDMLSRVLCKHDEWKLFFLGSTPYFDKAAPIDETPGPNGPVRVCRIMGPLCAHCYLVNRSAYDEMIDELPTPQNVWQWLAFHLSYDSWIANEYGKRKRNVVFGCYPNLCVQNEFYSDIEHVDIAHVDGRLSGRPFPVTLVSEREFEGILGSLAFRVKWGIKILAHDLLGIYYNLAGYRRFSVSINEAGYWGAFKAACGALRSRKSAH